MTRKLAKQMHIASLLQNIPRTTTLYKHGRILYPHCWHALLNGNFVPLPALTVAVTAAKRFTANASR